MTHRHCILHGCASCFCPPPIDWAAERTRIEEHVRKQFSTPEAKAAIKVFGEKYAHWRAVDALGGWMKGEE